MVELSSFGARVGARLMTIGFCPREKSQLICFPRPLVAGGVFCKIVKNRDEKVVMFLKYAIIPHKRRVQ